MLQAISAVFNACCLTRATNIISGPTHPAHHIFKFLLSVGDSESNNQAEKQLLSERTETAKWLKVLFVELILYTHTHTHMYSYVTILKTFVFIHLLFKIFCCFVFLVSAN